MISSHKVYTMDFAFSSVKGKFYQVVVVELSQHAHIVVVSKASSKSACVEVIVEFVVSKNNNPKNARLVEVIIYSFYINSYIITICDFYFSMLKLTYFPPFITIKISK